MIAPIDDTNDYQTDDEALVKPHIEPIFWGTSEILIWEGPKLLETLSKRIANTVGASEGAITEETVNRVAALLPEGILEPRGIYGYFPVIVERGALVLLDPSDFHSEMTILSFDDALRHYAESCHPDGDIIALSAVTTGIDRTELVRIVGDASHGTDIKVVEFIASLVLSLLNERCAMEIRRGMGILEYSGILTDAGSTPSLQQSLPALFEMMSIEERLGMYRNDDGKILPQFASLSLFLPRLEEQSTKK